jgi:DNA-binding NarL/FixJ family response regulator
MNSAPKVKLTTSERVKLEGALETTETPRALRLRTRAILACAEGKTNLEVARELNVTNLTVGKWRRQFLIDGLKTFELERRGRRLLPLSLNLEERIGLQRWARSSRSSASLAERARVILKCATGKNNAAVARETGLSPFVVGKLRIGFLRQRLEGLKRKTAGRRVTPLSLSSDEQAILERWSRSSSASQALSRRAKVILVCATGSTLTVAAQECGLSRRAVGHLRQRFLQQRLSAVSPTRNLQARRTAADL